MALFLSLAQLAQALAVEPGRLKKRAAIAEAIRAVHDDSGSADAGLLCLFLAGQPFAEADPRKLNAGGALLSRAVKEVSGTTDAALTAAYRKHGDLGAAAGEVWPAKIESTLTLAEVEDTFGSMATARTTAIRSNLVQQLLRRAPPLEATYLLKLMLADMRIGVKQPLIEEAIAAAANTEVAAVRHAVMLEADLALVVRMAFVGTLADAHMRLFHPLGFMLASPVETPDDAVARFAGKQLDPAEETAPLIHAFLEDKYDGMRAQLHCGDPTQPGRVALYSRSREDITESYPELVEAFRHCETPLILDGEILAWDFATNKALPFAQLGQRIGRKRVDNAMRRAVPIVFMAFDILFEREDLLLALPLSERRALLERITTTLAPTAFASFDAEDTHPQTNLFAAHETPSEQHPRLLLSPAVLVESAEQIDRAYADARARANEGVMLKAADSAYQPGRRGLAWVKLKRELATLDVVLTGAEFGHGKRAGLLSDYTFAVRGPAALGEPGELLNVGKAYSGVTDAEILELTAWLKAHTLEDHGHFRTVEPLRVLEVAFNNVMRSDRHASGFALRFPRILRIRDDKPVSEIDNLERVAEIFESQPDKVITNDYLVDSDAENPKIPSKNDSNTN
jgi:DNA ligase-1